MPDLTGDEEKQRSEDRQRYEEWKQRLDQAKALREQIDASAGGKLADRLQTLHRMFRVFLGNKEELRRHFAVYEDELRRSEFWAGDHSEHYDSFMDELDSRLHNYLAGAATLVDEAGRVWSEFSPEDAGLQAEYERRVETLTRSPLAEFIQAVRTLTIHRQLGSVAGRPGRTRPDREPTFDSATPLERPWWRPNEKPFPDAWWATPPSKYFDPTTDFQESLAAYTAEVVSTTNWVAKALTESHREALEDRNHLIAEHNALDPDPSGRSEEPAGQQAVIFSLIPGPDFDLEQTEQALESAAAEIAAEYDGNGFPLDSSQVEFFLYGEDADTLFDATAPVIRRAGAEPGSYAVKRYGNADEDPPPRQERIDL